MGSTSGRPIRDSAFLSADRAELAIIDRVGSPEQLRYALKRESAVSTLKLGARLLELGLITEDQLHGALQVQNADARRHLGEILLDLGLVSKSHLYQVLCEKLGIPLIELGQFAIDGAVLRLLPEELVRSSNVLPVCRVDGKLVVAVSDPLDPEPIERVRFFVQIPIVPVMAAREDIEQAIAIYYGGDGRAREGQGVPKPVRAEARRPDARSVAGEDTDGPVLGLVSKMIADASAAGASDIHIDGSAGPQHVAVRFRRDGELSEYARLPAHLRAPLVTRIKAIAGIDISERRRAQEGRAESVENGPADLQLRVVTVPTRDGHEDVAIKLMPARESLPLQMLGLSDPALETIKALLARPYGLLLISGPPGGGKTTTAYGLLTLLEAPGAKIWTAESPVETARPGLSQVEVNDKAGWDYPAAFRTIVRADPDVMLIGELRDRESAALAVEASLRGALVLSVLHGNSAPETLARLLDLGVDAFSLADALLGVVTQRLAKRLCLRCRIQRPLTAAEIDMLLNEYCAGTQLDRAEVHGEWMQRFGSEPLIYGAEGCDLCARTGYRGRIGLYEVLRSDAVTRTLVSQRKPLPELASAAIKHGMRTIKQDAIETALAGHCDIREVRAATV